MQCYDESKYRLLGYVPELQRYVLTDRLYEDNEICVKSAVVKTKYGKIRLSEGNKDNTIPELDLEIFLKRSSCR